ncbi:hypothetical protein OAK75_08775 [Bacteriovoracales bacterium]|nr:hypothetical protein [Bacteriovoracales bacterium]
MSEEKSISEKLEAEFKKIHLAYLIPDLKVPFGLYLPFKGKIIEVLRAGTPGSLEFFHRMASNGIHYAYLNNKDLPNWSNWKKIRHPDEGFFQDFSKGPSNEIKKNLAAYKARSFEKLKIIPSFFNEPEFYLEGVEKRYHDFLNEPGIVWVFNEKWVEKNISISIRLSYFMIIFLDHLRDHLMIYDEKNVLIFSVIHDLMSVGMSKDFKGKPEESTIYYIKKKEISISKEINTFFEIQKQVGLMKKDAGFKFDPSMPKGFQVFSLCKDLVESFEKINSETDQRMASSFRVIKSKKIYEEPLLNHLEKFLGKVKLYL